MIRQLLEEVKAAPLDEASRNRLKEIHQASIKELESRAGPRAGRGAGAAVAAVHRGGDALRGRAADRPGPAGRLARGPLPRHPDRDLRPADGRPRPARADAPAAAAGHGTGAAGPAARPRPTSSRSTSRATPAGCTSSAAALRRASAARRPGPAGRRAPAPRPARPAAMSVGGLGVVDRREDRLRWLRRRRLGRRRPARPGRATTLDVRDVRRGRAVRCPLQPPDWSGGRRPRVAKNDVVDGRPRQARRGRSRPVCASVVDHAHGLVGRPCPGRPGRRRAV